jgi:hypothetical protein
VHCERALLRAFYSKLMIPNVSSSLVSWAFKTLLISSKSGSIDQSTICDVMALDSMIGCIFMNRNVPSAMESLQTRGLMSASIYKFAALTPHHFYDVAWKVHHGLGPPVQVVRTPWCTRTTEVDSSRLKVCNALILHIVYLRFIRI